MPPTEIRIAAPVLQDFVADIFAHAGSSATEGGRIATYLVRANLAGHDSHGVVRVPRYLALRNDGMLVPDQQVERIVDTPVLAVLDARRGYGQTVTPQAVELGIEKCRHGGLSAVAVRNAGHMGRIADWAEMAADAGLVSVHFVNAAGSVLVAPFGSTERHYSTAPFCVGLPLPGQPPVLLDFATSIVAEGKVFVASQGGKKVPGDALVAPDGSLSDDPRLLYGDFELDGPRDLRKGLGALRAFGDHKGSGLALMCELLGGALTGGGCASRERPFANGMMSIYLDPTVIDPTGFFPGEALRYVEEIRQARAAPPHERTLVPGEPERQRRAERLEHGVPLPVATWRALLEAGRGVGLSAQRLDAAQGAAR